MIAWFKRMIALIVSARVAELELQLADRNFAMRQAEYRINDLELALHDCRTKSVKASDSWE